MTRSLLRPARFDDLGLKRAISDRLLPLLVGAMAFLAALALAGVVAASALARHWQEGAASELTVQVPHPNAAIEGGTRVDRVVAALRATPGVTAVRTLDADELADLLRPWLGADVERIAIPLPAVIEVHVSDADWRLLGSRVAAIAPGTLVESHETWMERLSVLARSLQACAGAATAIVAFVSAAMVAVATRAGLATRRDAIEIVHGLGATDAYIAVRFAARTTLLATMGAAFGALAALPVLLILAALAAPFTTQTASTEPVGLPLALWLVLPGLPLAAAAIGWATAQGTVRRWLRRLP